MEPIEPGAPLRRTGGRSARVRATVLDATLEALFSQGIDGLSVAEIAARAGVHPTSIYRRWGNRLNLALDAVLSRTEEVVPTPDTGSLRGDLMALLSSIATFLGTPLGELLVRLAVRRDLPEHEAARGRFWVERFAIGAAILERARRRGELRPEVDPVLALETLIAPLHLRLLLTGEPLDDRLLRTCVDMVLDGITSGTGRGAGGAPIGT